MINITPPTYARRLAHTIPAPGCAPEEPYGVLASVDGWKGTFWVRAGHGRLPVYELVELILKEFGKRKNVVIDVPLGDCTLFALRLPDLRYAPIYPFDLAINVIENNSRVILKV